MRWHVRGMNEMEGPVTSYWVHAVIGLVAFLILLVTPIDSFGVEIFASRIASVFVKTHILASGSS